MEKDNWLHQQHFSWQPPNLNCMSFLLDSGRREFFPAYTNPYASMVSPNGSLPGFTVAGLPQLKVGQVNEPHGWFYGLPRHRRALTPTPGSVPKEFSASPLGYGGAVPNALPGSVQKKYLVFDQSGDQTSLFFSSAVGSHIQNPSYDSSKPFHTRGSHMEEPATNREFIHRAGPVISTDFEENEETGDTSEMHEDTEELNALLYSDDEYDSDNEETSTGHSPRDMTGYQKQEVEESAEEQVASSACPIKRKRQIEEDNYTSSLVDTASSGEANESMECKDDAESSCGEGSRTQGEMGFLLPANKRLRREKIQETVSILQSIIPGGKGKDAILVLDEAIQYLRSLKLKAKSVNLSPK